MRGMSSATALMKSLVSAYNVAWPASFIQNLKRFSSSFSIYIYIMLVIFGRTFGWKNFIAPKNVNAYLPQNLRG